MVGYQEARAKIPKQIVAQQDTEDADGKDLKGKTGEGKVYTNLTLPAGRGG